ncbi:MAG: Ldh family oxidoreductase [Alphaproteobacteria bacterium]|jgi:LDH2 family malate/lactate/ureidoglycolate dehydrogenase|nr:Ldh family oxidoreductase [Alphaproteobacteria bacterium]HJP21751.1 Ldh family oxidoreductase [Alphaproteobacteria bacterium]
MTELYDASELIGFAVALLRAADMEPEQAEVVAPLLVEADLMGHTTHGLQLLGGYLGALEEGGMRGQGEPEVVSDRGAVVVWDGHYLSGVWLTARAIDLAVERSGQYGSCTLSLRRSHHIACLAAFLERATARGRMIILASSDPANSGVAPFGGRRQLYTPNPIAIGIPTEDEPVLIDISASITTLGLCTRLNAKGRRLEHPWLLDAEGRPSDDPAVMFAEPAGSIQPTGGLDHGHKGYGLALMIEALTQGLSGFGRADGVSEWGAAVYVQVLDPEAFAGQAPFMQQTTWLAQACRANPPAPGIAAVRLPGQRALERKRQALAAGVELYPGILESLSERADRAAISLPRPLSPK